ncbi:diiron oxygenase [Tsukamurella tyrosinosolvens]|uniref:AurF N-oxygenase family protein n=1 Tax=Tsukamurella tyrosinosolvens TaxID=57704 RepID=UPI001AFAB436|nr:diiron oxygenase [Tsukamurella tyrosinosolvens]MEC4615625.1 diiron oxygenase [Tsukamurella tyrosinosolvens]QRY86519.1 diiron oxygenase [Tsukamurella tyrosinosolvens]
MADILGRVSRRELDQGYRDVLEDLSEGSVHRRFDPFLDIDWDAPELRLDPNDPRWVLPPTLDSLGATQWYRDLPLERRIEIGKWRMANTIKVGAAFESILIRGMMQYIMKLPNQSPEFRYSLHEMTEECNHIQMFQELVNRIDVDVPGMRKWFRRASPMIGVLGGYAHVILFMGILGGEEPIDHYQKAIMRHGGQIPPLVLRTMEIHVAEEARHISFAHEFLHAHLQDMTPRQKRICALAFPLAMRWLVGEIFTPPKAFFEQFEIPREVKREAFWRGPTARALLNDYFAEMRALADDLGLMTPVGRLMWKLLKIDGHKARYRGEPTRPAQLAA